MKIFSDLSNWNQERKNIDSANSIGFVPTMGALHKGHLSLVEKSLRENDISIVSIFLNPTQFNNQSDFEQYPETIEQDIEMLKTEGVDYLIIPDYNVLYPDNYKYRIIENDFSNKLCGEKRPGHFDGVLTVVMKLLNIVKPDRAYFGEKDYQQYLLVKNMVLAFFLECEIVPCPIVRESSGLAYSSRNKRLTEEQLEIAPLFYSLLNSDLNLDEMQTKFEDAGFVVDYLKELESRRYGAVYLGDIRLIDNIKI